MKNLWGIYLILFAAFGMAEVRTVDRILAKVNDEIITLSELNREMEAIQKDIRTRFKGEQLEQALQKAEQEALNNLLEEKLIYQKAVDLGYEAHAEEQVSAHIQQIMRDNNLKDTEELENALAREGRSLREYRQYLERRIISGDLVNDYIHSRISILSSEIEKYYKNHIPDYTTPEEVTLSEIIISTADGAQDAENRANDLHRRLQQGESFAALASQFSKGPTANKGGSIGTYMLNRLNPDTVKAIAGLKEGDVSRPQKLADGYVLFRVDARKEAVVRPLEEVRDEIRGILYQQKREPEYERFINQLKEDAYIQIFPEMK